MENILPLFYRDLGDDFSFRDLLVATKPEFKCIQAELDSELQWASNRKTEGAAAAEGEG